jgi:hypothetical protein
MPMRTANWPGVPGKTQGKSRANGVKKMTQGAKSVGV